MFMKGRAYNPDLEIGSKSNYQAIGIGFGVSCILLLMIFIILYFCCRRFRTQCYCGSDGRGQITEENQSFNSNNRDNETIELKQRNYVSVKNKSLKSDNKINTRPTSRQTHVALVDEKKPLLKKPRKRRESAPPDYMYTRSCNNEATGETSLLTSIEWNHAQRDGTKYGNFMRQSSSPFPAISSDQNKRMFV